MKDLGSRRPYADVSSEAATLSLHSMRPAGLAVRSPSDVAERPTFAALYDARFDIRHTIATLRSAGMHGIAVPDIADVIDVVSGATR